MQIYSESQSVVLSYEKFKVVSTEQCVSSTFLLKLDEGEIKRRPRKPQCSEASHYLSIRFILKSDKPGV